MFKGISVKAQGSAGGIITLWNDEFFEVKSCISNDRYIIVSGVLLKLKKEVVFCNLYAVNLEHERVELWRFIMNAQISLPGPWVIGEILILF